MKYTGLCLVLAAMTLVPAVASRRRGWLAESIWSGSRSGAEPPGRGVQPVGF